MQPNLKTETAYLNKYTTAQEAKRQINEMCSYYGNLINVTVRFTEDTPRATLQAAVKELNQHDVDFELRGPSHLT